MQLKNSQHGLESALLAGESGGPCCLREVSFPQVEAAVSTVDPAFHPSICLAGQKPRGSCEPRTPAQDPGDLHQRFPDSLVLNCATCFSFGGKERFKC